MQKIDSDGATVDNLFTEGNPSLSVPATVVSAYWLNAVQKELVNLVEGLGITLNPTGDETGDQVLTAIKKLIQQGGQASALSFNIANNQASLADVTGFPQINVATTRSFEVLMTIVRRTDSGLVKQTGRLYGTWVTAAELGLANGAWDLSFVTVHDSAGVDFTMTLVSGTTWKLQYQSDNMAGASYTGNVKFTDLKLNLI
jgi:hypothetical protein